MSIKFRNKELLTINIWNICHLTSCISCRNVHPKLNEISYFLATPLRTASVVMHNDRHAQSIMPNPTKKKVLHGEDPNIDRLHKENLVTILCQLTPLKPSISSPTWQPIKRLQRKECIVAVYISWPYITAFGARFHRQELIRGKRSLQLSLIRHSGVILNRYISLPCLLSLSLSLLREWGVLLPTVCLCFVLSGIFNPTLSLFVIVCYVLVLLGLFSLGLIADLGFVV